MNWDEILEIEKFSTLYSENIALLQILIFFEFEYFFSKTLKFYGTGSINIIF